MLSTVIITFNEEDNIGRCLESVLPVSDEIIVIDSGSTDRTREICESFNVTFIENPFAGYSEQKNFGNERAAHDLILSIDADEALDPELATAISDAKQQPAADGYYVNRLTNYCGKWIRHCGWYPDRRIRVFDRRATKWSGTIHEKLNFADGTRLGQLPGDLLHYSFPTISSHAQVADKYSEIAARDAVARGRKINFLVHVVLNPPFTFIRDYFFKLGFLDGYYGFIVCSLNAYSNLLKYSKIWSLQQHG